MSGYLTYKLVKAGAILAIIFLVALFRGTSDDH